MRMLCSDIRTRATVAALLAALVTGCGKPAPTPDVPEPAVAPASRESAPASPAPTAPEAVAAVVAVPVPAAVPVAAIAPAAAAPEPALAAMQIAVGSAKLSVPVDLRYQFDGPVISGQPVTLHLAAVPRVAGSNLAVNIKEEPGARVTAGELRAQKVTATTAYRRQLSVTKLSDGQKELRVLVTMDMPLGSAFGWFSVPLDAEPTSQKQLVDKQQ